MLAACTLALVTRTHVLPKLDTTSGNGPLWHSPVFWLRALLEFVARFGCGRQAGVLVTSACRSWIDVGCGRVAVHGRGSLPWCAASFEGTRALGGENALQLRVYQWCHAQSSLVVSA